jgi:hypothetical protein
MKENEGKKYTPQTNVLYLPRNPCFGAGWSFAAYFDEWNDLGYAGGTKQWQQQNVVCKCNTISKAGGK